MAEAERQSAAAEEVDGVGGEGSTWLEPSGSPYCQGGLNWFLDLNPCLL